MASNKGWRANRNALAGVEALELSTGDPTRSPYVFGVGATDTGRLSTTTRAGASTTFPSGYGFGEAWELRFKSEFTASQFQGIFLQVATDTANTSAIKGMQIEARQNSAVAVGQLTGIYCKAIIKGATGDITTAEGGEVGVECPGTYTGTITNLYGLRVLIDTEDGSTITNGYGVYILNRAATGSKRLTAAIGMAADPTTTACYRYGIDSTACEFTNGSANEVVLWAFKGANGTTYYLIHDTDAATVLRVDTSDPTT